MSLRVTTDLIDNRCQLFNITSARPADATDSDFVLSMCFSSVSWFASGGCSFVVVERGVQTIQVPRCPELLPEGVPGPAHHPGGTSRSKHVLSKQSNFKERQTQALSLNSLSEKSQSSIVIISLTVTTNSLQMCSNIVETTVSEALRVWL